MYDPQNPPLMECGHTANATNTKTGEPSCVICVGLHPGANIVVERPSLEGREALCGYKTRRDGSLHTPIPSQWGLAFFEYRPDKPMDTYYCGCYGWD